MTLMLHQRPSYCINYVLFLNFFSTYCSGKVLLQVWNLRNRDSSSTLKYGEKTHLITAKILEQMERVFTCIPHWNRMWYNVVFNVGCLYTLIGIQTKDKNYPIPRTTDHTDIDITLTQPPLVHWRKRCRWAGIPGSGRLLPSKIRTKQILHYHLSPKASKIGR